MKDQDRCDLVCSSDDFNCPGVQLQISADDDLLLINSNGKVLVVSLKTQRIVRQVFAEEKMLSVWWCQDLICGLSWTFKVLSVSLNADPEDAVYGGGGSVLLKDWGAHLPHKQLHSAKVVVHKDGLSLHTVYCVVHNDQRLELMSICLGESSQGQSQNRTKMLGHVHTRDGRALFDANESLVLKCGDGGKAEGRKLVFLSLDQCRSWHHSVDQPVTAVSCPPGNHRIAATGSKSGKIFIWRRKNELQFFPMMVHWHSLPVRTINFTSEASHFFSAGGEGAILKWETKSGRRVSMVPRLGNTVTCVQASHAVVVASTEGNVIKVFSANLDDQTMVSGLSQEDCSQMFWHTTSRSLVLKGSRNRIQFLDPLLATQRMALDASSHNQVLGNGEQEHHVACISKLCVSPCGKWLFTCDNNWDAMGGQCGKLWHQAAEAKFELNTRINDIHDNQLLFASFFPLHGGRLSLLTCAKDCKAKLWNLVSKASEDGSTAKDQWDLMFTFQMSGLEPTCADISVDLSVLAMAFQKKITLWNISTLSLQTTLSRSGFTASGYQSIAFGHEQFSPAFLFAASEESIHVWCLLSGSLKLSMQLPGVRLQRSLGHLNALCSRGVYEVHPDLSLQLLTADISQLNPVKSIAWDVQSNVLYLATASNTSQHQIFSLTLSQQSQPLCTKPGRDGEDDLRPLLSSLKHRTTMTRKGFGQTSSELRVCSISASMMSLPLSRNALNILQSALPT